MPLYEYRCSKCAETFEVMRKFSDPPLNEHEGCGGTLERLLSAPAFQLKGTGWYATDYAKGGAKVGGSSKGESGEGKTAESKTADSKTGDSKAAESKSTENKSETKTESKPAATPTKND
jgi:putative FmdB family regulatory protein